MASGALQGKTVLVTGASSGIGRATALRFAARGADVVLAARREDRLDEVRRDAEALRVQALAVRCDVTRQDDVEQLMARVRDRFGGLDVLVNNAGVGLYGPIEALEDELLHRAFEVNVHGLVRTTRAALPLLRRRKGAALVNVSSVMGHRALPLLGGYSATKAAVNALTEALRAELAPEGIAVVLISPGLVESEFREHRLAPEGYKQPPIPLRAMAAETAGEEIVRAVMKRRRRAVLTLTGKLMVHGNRLAPRLMDAVATRMVGPMVAPEERK
jgi:short-subunit dehydrogenase